MNLREEFLNNLKESSNQRLFKLQQQFERGDIKEEDIEVNDKKALYKLYIEEIETLKKSINSYKDRVAKIIKNK